MTEMRHSRSRIGLLLAFAALMTAGCAAGAVMASPGARVPESADAAFTQVTGVGETMLIVVAGDYASPADAEAAAVRHSFGDLQGFYLDETNNYEVVGVYGQPSVDQRVVSCDGRTPTERTVCLPGLSEVRVYQPVALTYIPRANAGPFLSAADGAGCGSPGYRPCLRANLDQRLTPALDLTPNRYLLLSAFRTKQGAEEFVDLARAAGYDALTVLRVRKMGGGYVGLGQEANPDGVSGPLLEPLPDPATYQE